MRTPLKRGRGAAFAVVFLAAAGRVQAAVHVEFSLAAARKTPSFETIYVHSYVPPFYYTTVIRSGCEQAVAVKAEGVTGFAFGAAVYFGKHFGFRLAMDSLEAAISGKTTADRVSMTYVAMLPPDYVAREYSVTAEGAVPTPDGTLSVRSCSLAAVLRIGRPGAITFDISAGPALLRFETEMGTFGFHRYWLGGHSVLFSEFSQLRMSTGPTTKVGACFSFGAAVYLARPFALFIEARCTLGPKTEIPVSFAVVPGTEGISPYPLTLDALSGAAPLTVDPSYLSLAAGLRLSVF